jgi:hypothetical protein
LAPYAYTKVMRPVITALRAPQIPVSNGYKGKLVDLTACTKEYFAQIYIDDILILASTANIHTQIVQALLELLKNLGIQCHPGKCELTPVTKIEFLGMLLNIPQQTFELTQK